MVTGLIGKKLQMTQVFSEDGKLVPVTNLTIGPCVVVKVKKSEKHTAALLGFGHLKPKKLKKSVAGQFKEIKQKPAVLKEFELETEDDVAVNNKLTAADVFKIGDKVQVRGISKGRGFQGVVKRHGFSGGPKTHGQSDRHRHPGSIGGRSDPGRTFRGTRMGGHMGVDQITVKGLEVVSIDSENNTLQVKGAVPGYRGATIFIEKM